MPSGVLVRVQSGAFENGEPLTIPVERFFAMLRLEQRGRLAELPIDQTRAILE